MLSSAPTSTIFRDIKQASNLGARSCHRQIIQTSASRLHDEGQLLVDVVFELRIRNDVRPFPS